MSDISIRMMTKGDIDAVAGIQEAILQRRVTARWRKAMERHIENDPQACLVAARERAPVGFVVGDVKNWGFGLRRSGWIEIVGIHPKHMGSGVGKALGRRLMAYFRRMDVDGVYTTVRWDSGDLLSFFKSLGFERSDFITLEHRGAGGSSR